MFLMLGVTKHFIISFRSWPRGLSSFSVAKNNHAEAVRRDHEHL